MHHLIRSGVGLSPLRGLCVARDMRRLRVSSYDKSGGNEDFVRVYKGKPLELARIDGAGIINHIWMTYASDDPASARKIAIRIYWDGSDKPSVDVPIGDFFGVGHGLRTNYSCAVLSMSPQEGKGMNCWFPMPFAKGVRIEAINETNAEYLVLYFYIDYEQHESIPPEMLRFHALWRRDNPCAGLSEGEASKLTNKQFQLEGKNITGEKNYVILDINGRGHYVGCNLHITNLRMTDEWNWYGEGDDMIFVDGEKWPPAIHGTGTEDYFNTAFCPQQEVREPYHGVIFAGGPNWAGRMSLYRYHVEDSINFRKSIRVTIEHGHNNHRSDDYSSTAYWYQEGVNRELPPLAPLEARLPVLPGDYQ
jgi:hypothetical protein